MIIVVLTKSANHVHCLFKCDSETSTITNEGSLVYIDRIFYIIQSRIRPRDIMLFDFQEG